MAEFHFTNEHTTKSSGELMQVLRSPRLWIPSKRDYPDFNHWLDKTEAAIAGGTTRAMSARIGTQTVGAVIYKTSCEAPTTLQIKNISLAPDARGRHIASFLVRNVEIEAARHDFPECGHVTVDTKASNPDMINFLLSAGYDIDHVEDLYGLGGGLDVVFSKSLAVNTGS
jgi:ribosomal protein S18 acetylase RimI-like enzyme